MRHPQWIEDLLEGREASLNCLNAMKKFIAQHFSFVEQTVSVEDENTQSKYNIRIDVSNFKFTRSNSYFICNLGKRTESKLCTMFKRMREKCGETQSANEALLQSP